MDRPPSKKLTRKQIRKPDRFIDFVGRAADYLARKKNLLSGVGVAAFLILAGWWGWSLYREADNQAAAEKYFHASELSRESKHQEAVIAFSQAAEHRRSLYGQLALLQQAHSQVALKAYPEAVGTLRELLRRERRNPFLRQIAWVNLGYVQEMLGQCADALGSYAEAQRLEGSLRNEALLGQARCGVQTGQLTTALDAFRQYLSAYPASERTSEVSVRLHELEAAFKQSVNNTP